MTTVEQLLAAFIAEHRGGGETDPRAFLSQAASGDRRELAALIDAYLAGAPRRAFSGLEFTGSTAERTVDALERSLAGQAGLWPSLLPRLRTAAGLKRADLVTQLAARLEVSGREDKVGLYYHQMEQGLLPSTGVSDRVIDALGEILGEPAGALRAAGESLAAPGSGTAAAGAAFARTASGTSGPGGAPGGDEPGDWDEVDELFRAR